MCDGVLLGAVMRHLKVHKFVGVAVEVKFCVVVANCYFICISFELGAIASAFIIKFVFLFFMVRQFARASTHLSGGQLYLTCCFFTSGRKFIVARFVCDI